MTLTLEQAIEKITYSGQCGIWASLNDSGKFSPDSDARYGQPCFENGGMLDEFLFFGNGESIHDFLAEWGGIIDLIDNVNEQF